MANGSADVTSSWRSYHVGPVTGKAADRHYQAIGVDRTQRSSTG